MATQRIGVNGGADARQKNVFTGDNVLWVPATPRTEVQIDFGNRSPVEWLRKSGRPGAAVRGTVQAKGPGRYPYNVGRSPILAGPELIVDGGLVPKRKPKTAAKKKTAARKTIVAKKKTVAKKKGGIKSGAKKKAAKKR